LQTAQQHKFFGQLTLDYIQLNAYYYMLFSSRVRLGLYLVSG